MQFNIDLEVLKTENDMQIEAKKHVDTLLRELGAKAAKKLCNVVGEIFRHSDKVRFAKESSRNAQRTATMAERRHYENKILSLIRQAVEQKESHIIVDVRVR